MYDLNKCSFILCSIVLLFFKVCSLLDKDWVKKCMDYEVEGARPRGRPKKTWRDCGKDCQARKLNTEDAMDRNRWRKQMTDDHDRCEWVNVSSGTGSLLYVSIRPLASCWLQ